MSLRRFILKRLLLTVPILFGVSVITFALVHLTPGDPISQMVAENPNVSQAEEAQLRAQYGLDGTLWEQYATWIGNVLSGDFGDVYGSSQSVAGVLISRLPETIALGLFGWVFALVIAIPTGVYAAINKDKFGDTASRIIALSGISIPNFWLGLMLILVGALWLGWWDVGAPRTAVYHPEMLWFLILPGITVGTAAAASIMRVMRTSMAEELNKEYVVAARAKGLPERKIILKHVLRNSMISVVTLAAMLTASIVAGSVVVETVFNWPGLGRELVQAIHGHEINLIMAITLFTGFFIVLANLLADILYAVLDPRIRYD
ncbi:ABC transporter permease [Natronolimnohabitans innermongolicus]|uniref:Oligopeptide ABC transporter permease n=1 Tax=Natronolimnohabitans innermongolicus JCM 12255 TaxID=1227499 RepID=L9XD08_9EURY|nr:ABC transporter permease [Natronolimnohabitans innermongolicus]ELY59635.1 oligopeptide ABC transporter permease [Natronolimnohabitans innermongolicus JCM 12255]